MPGTSAAHTIWFIVAVLVAAVLAGAVVGITYSITKSLDEKSKQIQGELNTKIVIINDPDRVPYSKNNTLTFYVSNIGSSVLNKNSSYILVQVTTPNSVITNPPKKVYIFSGTPTWKNGEIAVINVTALGLTINTDYSVWITVSDIDSGVTASDTMNFNIVLT